MKTKLTEHKVPLHSAKVCEPNALVLKQEIKFASAFEVHIS